MAIDMPWIEGGEQMNPQNALGFFGYLSNGSK